MAGKVRQYRAGLGMARQARLGVAKQGMVRCGRARLGLAGLAWYGKDGRGKAWRVWEQRRRLDDGLQLEV